MDLRILQHIVEPEHFLVPQIPFDDSRGLFKCHYLSCCNCSSCQVSGRLLVDGTFLSELPFFSTKAEVILIPFLYSPGSKADESLIGVVGE